MRRILITGANSYIGTSFENWMKQWPQDYEVSTVGTKNDEWRSVSFKEFDVVFHVAGIAHIKENEDNRELYFKVNRDLAYEIAQTAKASGVRQFIYLSSMSVYGKDEGEVENSTPLKPINAYGQSKAEAESLIQCLHSDDFQTAILRPPMVYGANCRGNYVLLSWFAKKTFIFPSYPTKRSMVFINNLCEFTRFMIDEEKSGVFTPQDQQLINVAEMVDLIAKSHHRKLWKPKLFNPIIFLASTAGKNSALKKVFGSLYYSQDQTNISFYKNPNYQKATLKEAVLLSEKEVVL